MKITIGCALLGALLASASGPEYGWWFLAPVGIGVVVFVSSVDSRPSKRNLLLTVFSISWVGFVYSWLTQVNVNSAFLPFTVWLFATICTAVPMSIALQGAVALHSRGWPIYFALPTVWLVLESVLDVLARTCLATTIDPMRLGITQASGPFAAIAAIGGVSLLSWVTASGAGLCAELLDAMWSRKRIGWTWYCTILLIAIITFLPDDVPGVTGRSLRVAIIPQSVSDPIQIKDAHQAIQQHERIDLAIWPETALANRVVTVDSFEELISDMNDETVFVIGAVRLGNSPPGLFNCTRPLYENW